MGRPFDGTLRFGDLPAKFAGYFVVGGLSALVDFALFTLFLEGLGVYYLLAATLSFVLATAFNYVLSVRYVFRDGKRPRHHEVTLVYVVSAVGIAINLGVLALSVEVAALHPLIGKIVGTGSAFAWNFTSRYFWVFAPAETDAAEELGPP